VSRIEDGGQTGFRPNPRLSIVRRDPVNTPPITPTFLQDAFLRKLVAYLPVLSLGSL
jgi:hypothetical protein